MTTTTPRPPTTSRAIFHWHSLKTRLTISTLTFFLVGVWSLAFYSGYTLRHDMEYALSEQQFSTVSVVAADINTELDSRTKALERVAARITPAILGNTVAIQKFLEDRIAFPMLFNAGVYATGLDGVAVADVPISAERIGVNYMDRGYIVETLKGKTTISDPIISKKSQSPSVVISTPIRGAKGEVIGVLAGRINLSEPSFLSKITDNKYGKTGGYLLVSPQLRTIIYATDKKRIMEALPAPGINPLIDRFIQGYDGSGVVVNPLGIEVLASAKGIPVSGWYVAALIPTEEAFAPVHALQKRVLLATIFLTLLAGGLTWWMLKHQLAPVFTTIKTLATLSDIDLSPQPLPIARRDEIGELIGGFNSLLENLRKREQTLQKTEERYRTLFSRANDGIFVISREGKLIEVNDSLAWMHGYTKDEMLHMSLKDFDTPESFQMFPDRIRRLLAGESLTFEANHYHKDGHIFPLEVSASLISYGAESFIQCFHRDITDRKEAEKVLQETESRFRAFVEQAPVAIGVWNLDGTGLYANRKFIETLGLQSVEDVVGRPAFDFFTPQFREDSKERTRRRLQGLPVPTEYESILLRTDGVEFPVHVAVAPIQLSDKTVNISFLTDLTERKQAEEEKRKLEERLQHADKMEAIGTLAGGIAHDFNNLLMGIQGYASLTLQDLDPRHPHHERLKQIEEQVQSGANLTKQLLGFARGGRYDVKPADMNDIIKETSSMFGRTKKEITIHRKYGRDLRPVEVDRGQMEQVFMNLYVNAWQAMPGGGEIYLETEDVLWDDEPATPYTMNPGRYVKIAVSDTGIGMDEKTKERIFEPFFTTKEMGRGTGLGLATVYGIIKGHKGMIHVDSEPGHGTTFHIYLPASEREMVKEKTATGTIAKGTETILLVDDEKMVLEVSKELLESMGYRVYPAGSGQEALAVYMEKRKEIDLVILDMIMPGISGGETFDRLREIHPGIKVLLSSGYSIEGQAQEIMDRGCNGFLQKPFRLANLSRNVRETID